MYCLNRVHSDQNQSESTKSPNKPSDSPDVETNNGSASGKSSIRNESESKDRHSTNTGSSQDEVKSESKAPAHDQADDIVPTQQNNDASSKEIEVKKNEKCEKSDVLKNSESPSSELSRPSSNHTNQAERNIKNEAGFRNQSPRTRSNGSDGSRMRPSTSHVIESGGTEPNLGLVMAHGSGALKGDFNADRVFTHPLDVTGSANPVINQFEINPLFRNMLNQYQLQPADFSHAAGVNTAQSSPYMDQRHLNLLSANNSLSQYGMDAATAYYLNQHHTIPGYSGPPLSNVLNSANYAFDVRKFDQTSSMMFSGLASGMPQGASTHQNGMPSMIPGIPSRLSAPTIPSGSSNKPIGASSIDQLQLVPNPVSTHTQPSYAIHPPSGEEPTNPLHAIPIATSLLPSYAGYQPPDARDDRSK